MISIMNGVHCQISVMMIDKVGCSETNSTGVPPSFSITQLMTPYRPWNIWFFQIRPMTTGTSRNGVISIVRTIPRPKNLRSSSSANAVPSTSAAMHREHRELDARHDRVAEEVVANQLSVVVEPDELARAGRHDRPVREAVIDAQRERDLRQQDR